MVDSKGTEDSEPKSTEMGGGENFTRYLADYEPLGEIGKGGYGRVFRCKHRLDDGIYAIKMVPFNGKDLQKTLSEVRTLRMMSEHPHVLRYYQCWIEAGHFEVPSDASSDDPELYSAILKDVSGECSLSGSFLNPVYQAPELKLESSFNEKVDIYSAGLVLHEMLHSPFGTAFEKSKLFEEAKVGKIPKDMGEKESALLEASLENDPSLRMSAKYIIAMFL